ncbi:MAG: hypothetical protein WB987_14010 [Candidatus Acidiferrales bacterium]
MKHFTTDEWVDFVRGTVAKDKKAVMQIHLESGCKRCEREATTWQRVRDTASRSMALEPDDSVVRFVKGTFAISGKRHASRSRGSIAELLFDSLREPLQVGVRSAATASSRQLLFGAGDLRIDLRLEPQIDSENVALIGQILDSAAPTAAPAAASVALLKDGKVVSEASTNRFGEFQLQCDLAGGLELRVKLPLRKAISVSLIDPVSAARASSDNYDSNGVKKLLRTLKSTRKSV